LGNSAIPTSIQKILSLRASPAVIPMSFAGEFWNAANLPSPARPNDPPDAALPGSSSQKNSNGTMASPTRPYVKNTARQPKCVTNVLVICGIKTCIGVVRT
jgi:hypothetical protein